MSALILCAVALCVCASGCDMVPPVKMVNQTTLSEPIPVRKTAVEACNACITVAKCEPLWKLVSQWCAAWNNTINNTNLTLLHPFFSGEPHFFPFSTKLIVETQNFSMHVRCLHKSPPEIETLIQGVQHNGEVKYIPKDNPDSLELKFDRHIHLIFNFRRCNSCFSCLNFTQLATESPDVPSLLLPCHLPPALHSTPIVDPTTPLGCPFKHYAAFDRAPTPPLLLLLGVTDHPNQTAGPAEMLVPSIEDPPPAACAFREHQWTTPYPFVWGPAP